MPKLEKLKPLSPEQRTARVFIGALLLVTGLIAGRVTGGFITTIVALVGLAVMLNALFSKTIKQPED